MRVQLGSDAGVKIAITGATGNVGTAVVEALLRRSEVDRIVGVARRKPEWCPDQVEWIAADIAVDDLDRPFNGCDVVIHLAWQIQPNRDRDVSWRTNVLGTERALIAADRAGVKRFVHASSVGAYSPAAPGTVVDENWPTHGIPQLGYSWQKAYVERMLDAFEQSSAVAVARMRPALIFRHDVAHEIRRLFLGRLAPTALLGPWARRIVDALPTQFQVVHSFDAADAYARVALSQESGAFNIAAAPTLGSPISSKWLVPVAHNVAAIAWKLRAVAAEPGWVDLALRAPVMDTSRARSVLGWTARHSAHDVIAELLSGFHDGGRFATPPLSQS
jgi:UDP-glucose 4-epimerase